MNSRSFGAFIEVDNVSGTHEATVLPQRAAVAAKESPSNTELDDLAWGRQHDRAEGNFTPSDIENSSPVTPKEFDVLQSWTDPYMNRFRLLSACITCFGNGLNDSAPGALIPYIEKDYHIGYAVVSLIFVTNAIGFISAAFFTRKLNDRIGRAKTLIIAQSLMLCGYIPIVCRLPFPVVVASFLFLGLGMALNLAMNNTFCANLANPTPILGAFHGSYGIGGTVGPLMATSMVSRGHHWTQFYFITIAVTMLTLVFSGWSFWNFEKDAPVQLHSALEQIASRLRPTLAAPDLARLKTIKIVILAALFIFAYQGAEVSISGWITSFLIAYRNGNPAQVGYITAGFWGGITLGRFFLVFPAHLIGEKTSVAILTAGAVVFETLVWVIPNVIGNAVAVAIVGLLLGPIYPCATTVFSRLIPKSRQISSLSIVSALGSSGGAIAPFMTGLLAQAVGTYVLHPLCIGLFVLMEIGWFCLPKIGKKKD